MGVFAGKREMTENKVTHAQSTVLPCMHRDAERQEQLLRRQIACAPKHKLSCVMYDKAMKSAGKQSMCSIVSCSKRAWVGYTWLLGEKRSLSKGRPKAKAKAVSKADRKAKPGRLRRPGLARAGGEADGAVGGAAGLEFMLAGMTYGGLQAGGLADPIITQDGVGHAAASGVCLAQPVPVGAQATHTPRAQALQSEAKSYRAA
eukprot:6490988-Amphidinium_carterae.1